MSEQRHLRVEALFAQAADLPQQERAAFLDAACLGAPDLRAEVEGLLAYDATIRSSDGEQGFLKSPLVRAVESTSAGSSSPRSTEDAGRPRSIGRYRILRWHGEGGMGTVYEAEQDNPRRTVALKVIRLGLVSPELVKRFNHEAQILARLQHPGIAQVHEAGTSEDGRPFFAMEFISGMPLDEYAQVHGLGAAARLELLARVCDAVQHAHNKGIIHRDLKPGNILVDESGQPKVLDFGVAHVTVAELLTTSSRTQAGQLLGTLSYMSPEQIAADATGLDGRSDVYTLGVILYELLAHRLPYDLDQLPMHAVARVIQQQEPPRLGLIDALYRGDVEILVAKALEKDKSRRYASAGDLAMDVRRFLRGEPILARPASALYQLRKFARRNKGLVAGVSGTFAALVLGTIVSIHFAIRAADNARVANERERLANYQTYRARIAAAAVAVANHDVVDAARQLDAAPEASRDWEWWHLRTRLDDSSAVLPTAAGESRFLIPDPKSVRVATWTPVSLRITDLDGHEVLTRYFRPVSDLILRFPLPTRQGLRIMAWDGKPVASSDVAQSEDRTPTVLLLVDDEGHVRTRLKGPPPMHAGPVGLSPDGSRLAVLWMGAKNWVFTLYDPESAKPVATSAHDFGFCWAVVFSPDGTRIATAGEDGMITLWDAATGTMIAQCRGHSLKVLSVAFRPDGRRMVTTSADGTVRQWDSSTGSELESPYERHTGKVMTAAYSPDGLLVASGGTDRTIRVWGASSRQDIAVLHGHTGVISNLAFTADGRRLASASLMYGSYTEDGTVRLWDFGRHAGTSVLRGHTSYIYPVAYSPDGQWIASGSWDNTVRLWDAITGESCAVLAHRGIVRALAFGPDSSWLVSGCDTDGSLQIWNVATGRLMKKIKVPGSDRIQAIAVSPDGTRIAAAARDGSARITETATGAFVHSFRMSPDFLEKRALAYSPDGRHLAGTGQDGTQIDVWDTQTGERSARLAGHTGMVYSVAFSGDGRLLASAGLDHTVRVWNVAAASCVTVLTGHTDPVFSAVFHPDGKRLASAGREGTIWLWNLATGQEVARLQGHTNYIFTLAFSPDGATLVSGSGDGTVRLWDTEPPARRLEAGRQADSLRPDAENLVARLFAELHEPAEVVARLRADKTLSDPQRRAGIQAVMRRGQQAMP